MAAIADRIYPHLPVFLQNTACWLYGRREAALRYDTSFARRFRESLESEWWDEQALSRYRDEQVRRVVRNAFENVPFHRRRMQVLGLTASDIQCAEQLTRLPVLTKEDVRANERDLLSLYVDRSQLIRRNTSGSTGTSLYFWLSRHSIPMHWALVWRHRKRFGIDYGALHANFTGKLAVPPQQRHPPFWRLCTPLHQAFVGSHHIVRARIADIVGFLDRHDFAFYSGYPSILHVLAETAMDAGLSLQRLPRLVATGAENLLDLQRRAIEQWTQSVVSEVYGMSEGCGHASMCPEGVYHEDCELGLLECHEPQSMPDGCIRGRLICTAFQNDAFPLIRYEVGDNATFAPPSFRCPCGRKSRVILAIDGRTEDYILTPEGRRLMRLDYMFKESARVREAQIVQRERDAILIRLVRRPGYGSADEDRLRQQAARFISPQMRVDFEYVPEIERGPSGKFKAVKSELPVRKGPYLTE